MLAVYLLRQSMTFANNFDPDEAPHNVGPYLKSKLFDTWIIYSTDNVFVVILFVHRTYIDGIFIGYRWYVNGFIFSFIILQLTDGTIQTNDHTIGFGEEVWCIRIVHIWYNVRLPIDYRSYIVRISRKRKH